MLTFLCLFIAIACFLAYRNVAAPKNRFFWRMFVVFMGVFLVLFLIALYQWYSFISDKLTLVLDLVSGLSDPSSVKNLVKRNRIFNLLEMKRILGFLIYQLFQRITYNPNHGGHVMIDTSTDLESSIIFEDMQTLKNKNFVEVVIDIGAADGILGSNSFLFHQLSMPVVFVEPDPDNSGVISRNYVFKHKNFLLLNWAIGNSDGVAKLFLGTDNTHTSNSLREHLTKRVSDRYVEVEVHRFQSLIQKVWDWLDQGKTETEQFFLMISIDAEGMEDVILPQIESSKIKPIYIVFEDARYIEEGQKVPTISGYKMIKHVGPNQILKHQSFF